MELQSNSLIWVSILMIVVAGISILAELRLAKTLLWAGCRATVQLLTIGVLLNWIFQKQSILLTSFILGVMVLIASQAALSRVHPVRFSKSFLRNFFEVFVSLGGSTFLCIFFASAFVLKAGAWHLPEVMLPFSGLLLGNSLTGISLGMSHWQRSLLENRELIETRLALGATAWESVHSIFRQSMITAMTPLLNSMTVAGIVSLPGMMTGQILAGASPDLAVRYQIATLLLISICSFFGTGGALLLGYAKIFRSHQLRLPATEPMP